MSYDRDELDTLLYLEARFGLTKTVGTVVNTDTVDSVENELVKLLLKYKEINKITNPLPRIKMWLSNDKLNFMFFDKKTGKRVLLGQWLDNKGGYDG